MSQTGYRTFRGHVKDGKVHLADPERLKALCEKIEGKQIEVRIVMWYPNRSLNQNSWYWGVIVPMIAEYCGYEPEEVHSALKEQFLKDHTDAQLPRIRSTASLTTAEFTIYIDACRRLAAGWGVVIPDPQPTEFE